jgi:hypothetical protein
MRRNSVQQAYVPVVAIQGQMLCLRDPLEGMVYRAVLRIGSVDFGTKAPADQESLIATYAAVLHGQRFAVQMIAQVRPLDLETYCDQFRVRRAELHAQEGVQAPVWDALASAYLAYLRRMSQQQTTVTRDFYLVIPTDRAERTPAQSLLASARGRVAGSRARGLSVEDAALQLTARCDGMQHELERLGLVVSRLDDWALVQLVYHALSPTHARQSPLTLERYFGLGTVHHVAWSKEEPA